MATIAEAATRVRAIGPARAFSCRPARSYRVRLNETAREVSAFFHCLFKDRECGIPPCVSVGNGSVHAGEGSFGCDAGVLLGLHKRLRGLKGLLNAVLSILVDLPARRYEDEWLNEAVDVV